ncbi:sarcosine oxidase subunit alpha family protein [Cognatishimia activa]|uniref:sarcosine oxidase subunit alpha family protein n=1 Tax=Cognatishimia activa TaxID=1715691 RepID=UPI0006F1AD4B|nr:sarcosine oxidase subunit alpha family protein [Cognatishimia activa]CUI32271.1 Aminomethyltransferase [Cognatishimia activa]
MTQMNRLNGGLVNRDKPLEFTFEGRTYSGFEGDTVASALLANGVQLMGRSFKYHRPRGVLSAGSEEPNGLMEIGTGADRTPNSRATVVELYDGLTAASQNAWPSLERDFMGVNDLFANFLTAGFYYKTFMWPKAFWEKIYEPIIRNAAGLGALSMEADPSVYDKGFLHCDLLVIGAGPSGLMAALTAARAGAQVILADEDFRMGGRLNAESYEVGGQAGSAWAQATLLELASLDNVRLMSRTTVLGAFDHGIFSAVERVTEHLPTASVGAAPRQTLWRIYAKRSLLCAGALERTIAFSNNDRPGILQAGAMRAYAHRWAATVGQRVAVFTNNDDGHRTAKDLADKGVTVVAVIDPREVPPSTGVPVIRGQVVDTKGRLGLKSVQVRRHDGGMETLKVDALGVSGGWNPNVSLTCHQRGRPNWREDIAGFVPGDVLPVGMAVAGAANGDLSTHGALSSGAKAAVESLEALGISSTAPDVPDAEDAPVNLTPLWYVGEGKARKWIDFQNDVTVKDVKLAHQEGFESVEHLKRYTTLGMATDQGKNSNLGGLAVMAEMTGKPVPQTGTTIFRPPYTPVAMGALAGRSVGKEFKPTRLTPSHHWAVRQGAVFVEVGQWMRAQWFPQAGETHWRQSVDRESLAVRKSVGICDVTTLGKVDVQGKDAAQFLNMIYANAFAKLPVGKTRYGLMLREDGIAMDDGTAARLAEDHFVVTTTTANAGPVYRHMEFVRQGLCPDMDVQLISTTDAWAQYAVAGPNSRKLLQKIVDPEFDISNDAFPFMACGEITVCGGIRARLFRISFSGEMAYEIAVPTRYGESLIEVMMEAGKEFDVVPYGTETLSVLRIEKGHAAGNELNGQIAAAHLGMIRMVSTKKDSIGAVMTRREELVKEDGLRLMGFEAIGEDILPAGSHVFAEGDKQTPEADQGWLTSACYSPHLGKHIALGYIKGGYERKDEVVTIANPVQGKTLKARVVSAHFVDPEGARLRD